MERKDELSGQKLSIIIVSWNDWPKLRKCLESVHKNDIFDCEVLVIDNSSNDDTVKGIKRYFPNVRIHKNDMNLGHARGANIGFSLARGRFILLLDSDAEIVDGAIERLVRFMLDRPDVSMASPRVLNTDGTIQETARNLPNALSGVFGRQTLLTRIFPSNPFSRRYLAREHLDATEPFQVEQVGANCMIFPRSMIDEVGAWDERYFGYWVDTDWCMALKRKGKKVFCLPEARVIHHESHARGKKKSAKRIWDFHLGAYRYFTKWHCFGAVDPRSVAAGLALLVRALLLMLGNTLKATEAAPGKATRHHDRTVKLD